MKKALWFAGALVALPATLNGGQGTSDFLRYEPSGQWAGETTTTTAPTMSSCGSWPDTATTNETAPLCTITLPNPPILPDDPVALLKYRWWELAIERNRYVVEYDRKLAAIETALKKLR